MDNTKLRINFKILKLLSLIALVFSFCACGKKTDDSSSNTKNVMLAWDDSSMSFQTSSFGGIGPSPGGPLSSPSAVKCRQSSYSYAFSNGVLRRSVCNNVNVGYEDTLKTLNAAETNRLIEILKSISFETKGYNGQPCAADGGGTVGGFIQVYQTNNVTKILDTTSEAPCGVDSGRYIYGKISNFNFLDQVDSIFQ